MTSQIFLDSGDPLESQKAKTILKSVDGQTTNPTLISKNPLIRKFLDSGKKLSEVDAIAEYKKIVIDIAKVVKGPISIQVIADEHTNHQEMIKQAKNYHKWIENAVVKFPITREGLKAAEIFCLEGKVNLTLNFSQSQGAAVYQATKKAKFPVFLSPFVGRLDDNGENGMELVANLMRMFDGSDGHVQVLTSSVRLIEHLNYALVLKSPAITIPLKIATEWAENNLQIPGVDYLYDSDNLKSNPYKPIKLDSSWESYDISHPLTTAGVNKFMLDWKSITK